MEHFDRIQKNLQEYKKNYYKEKLIRGKYLFFYNKHLSLFFF